MPTGHRSLEQLARAERDLRTIAAYRAGRLDAFDELVRSYQPAVQRVLAQLDVGAADAEDLAQEVFVRVYRNLHRFRGGSSFYTWLYRITINVFFDHSKKRKRADVRLQRLQHAVADLAHGLPDPGDPFRLAFEQLTADAFARAIAALPEAFRDVVAMREVDDLSYEEIALRIGISIGTVRSRLSRARARLKQLLGPELAAA
jgi:RNA polymerase sigma-70 factor, ECF subfamily